MASLPGHGIAACLDLTGLVVSSINKLPGDVVARPVLREKAHRDGGDAVVQLRLRVTFRRSTLKVNEVQWRRREGTTQAAGRHEHAGLSTRDGIARVRGSRPRTTRYHESDATRTRDVGDTKGLGSEFLAATAIAGVARCRALGQEVLRADVKASHRYDHGLAAVQARRRGDVHHRHAAGYPSRAEFAGDVECDAVRGTIGARRWVKERGREGRHPHRARVSPPAE